ncbi:hypothetical protein, partial [Treponema endosymbiont of Eucomonympha sp.]|uniref:hypothetical protein n=1 Tax=Treponema endosymbiont of Eucomonympha sp. TaxID=1580831 RepID=UPI001396BAB0
MIKYSKFFILLFLILLSNNLFAQNSIPEPSQAVTVPYRLFRTQNMWAFIELETATGRMWQIHFAINDDNSRGQVILNAQNLAEGRDVIVGRFTLHPAQNIYTFILHDQIDGRTRQVQWSNERMNRLIIPIG